MSKQCINIHCKSKNDSKLFPVQQSICSYYNVRYKPYYRVCKECMTKNIAYSDARSKKMKSIKCVNEVNNHSNIIQLSDSDDSNTVNYGAGPSTVNLNPRMTKLSVLINTSCNNCDKSLLKTENEESDIHLIPESSKLIAGRNKINNLMKELDNDLSTFYDYDLSKLYNKFYNFDNQQKFIFDEKESIEDYFELEKIEDNDEANISTKLYPGPEVLPEEGILKRRLLKSSDKVFGMNYSLMHPWIEATIKSAVSDSCFNIIFGDGEETTLNITNLAYINTKSNAQYPVGCRVIAKLQDNNIKSTNGFFVGIIAEPPKYLNNFRYLIFFDNGYTQYVHHQDIRLVCGESTNVSDDVHENVREFVKVYLSFYPERSMLRFNKKQVVRAVLDKKWYLAEVSKLDASLVQLKFLDIKNKQIKEWIYRGSDRLGPIYVQANNSNTNKRVRGTMSVNIDKILNRPYIELENLNENKNNINIANSDNTPNNNRRVSARLKQKAGKENCVIKIIEIPRNCPKPFPYENHQCSDSCMLRVQYNYSQTKNMNVLSIPLHFGFKRIITKSKYPKSRKVIYTTPCGYKIYNEYEMYDYLKKTGYHNNQMTIDLFNFDYLVNPLSFLSVPNEFIRIHDISCKLEFKTISVANNLNDLVPENVKYIIKRKTTPGVNLNLNLKLLCGCDCTDNCEDKTKCFCWQLTYKGPKNYPKMSEDPIVGYNYRRLYAPVHTGIFECNDNCKCMKTCLNRVVQEPLKNSLQMFLTQNKGWGVRTLADIPKGGFVSIFVGELRTEKIAESICAVNGDEYLADLDFLKTVEEIKDGYESCVPEENENSTSSSDDDRNPGLTIKNKKTMSKSKMSLKKNLPSTKANDKHQLCNTNTQHKFDSKHISVLKYLDEDCGVYSLDAKARGNIGRYFNHSCDPNMFVQNVFVDTHDLRFPWVAYFALSHIPAGDELTWNYNYAIGSVKNKKLKCYCGSKNCKGRLL
ncbi:histone-lysine N-methyltransferase eggless-like [Melanaphis sacchari]|uniref:histone-lysine N-methyltransferase eggless-like n=1 Tax=Melanaphis sacchari TaxID=742174 RepID=UPI000DC1350B|nr:histone-lysine N-methyltransferase eggless-like [Melanaphis sacchari]